MLKNLEQERLGEAADGRRIGVEVHGQIAGQGAAGLDGQRHAFQTDEGLGHLVVVGILGPRHNLGAVESAVNGGRVHAVGEIDRHDHECRLGRIDRLEEIRRQRRRLVILLVGQPAL